MTSTARYSRAAILLHWLIAAALAFQLGLGLRAEQLDQGSGLYDVLQLHKSIGITILLLTLVRVTIRFFKPPPPSLGDEKWAQFLAKLVHVLLYAFMIGAPLTGWLVASSSKLEIDTTLFGTVPWPHVPGIETLTAETKASVHEISETAHEYLAWLGVALFALHVAGALRHQFLKSEPLLARMLPVGLAHKRLAGSILIAGIAALFGMASLATRGVGLKAGEAEISLAPITNPDKPTPVSKDAPTKLELPKEDESAENVEVIEEQSSGPEQAAEPEKSEPTAKPELVPSWTVTRKDPIKFSVNRNGSSVQGSFFNWNADIKFSAEALDRSSATVTVNLASARTGDGSIDQALQGADFFSTSSFTNATISLNRFRSLGGNRYEANGQLNLKGVSKPVKVVFTLEISGATAKADGTASISRSAHKVGVGEHADIADNVSISFSLTARL